MSGKVGGLLGLTVHKRWEGLEGRLQWRQGLLC